MRENQLGWESFIDKFPDPIARYGKDYEHLFINEAIESLISMPASEVIGKSNRDLRIPNDEAYLSELENKIKLVFDTGQPAVNYTQHEFPDETRYYYMKLTPDFHDQGERNGCVRSVWAVTRDITQLKQTEIGLKNAKANLRKQNAALNRLNADLDTFFDTVSHDLRGPLHNIQGLTQLLKDAKQEEIPEYIQMLEKATQRVDDVLTGLTGILESKNKQEQLEETALDAVLQIVLGDFQQAIHQAGATIDADFSGCTAVRYARPFLESLFRNMIGNAIKYRTGERSLHIQIECRREDGLMVLSFQDNGQGMDMEKNGEKIFKPFYQIDSNQEGKGMGLSIVKNILERNGGRVEVKSELGAGSTFVCYMNEM